MHKKLITKYPEKTPKISPPADSCAKTQSGNGLVEIANIRKMRAF